MFKPNKNCKSKLVVRFWWANEIVYMKVIHQDPSIRGHKTLFTSARLSFVSSGSPEINAWFPEEDNDDEEGRPGYLYIYVRGTERQRDEAVANRSCTNEEYNLGVDIINEELGDNEDIIVLFGPPKEV